MSTPTIFGVEANLCYRPKIRYNQQNSCRVDLAERIR